MAHGRHRAETRRRTPVSLVAGPVAVLATASVVGFGVSTHDGLSGDLVAAPYSATSGTSVAADPGNTSRQGGAVSRSAERREALRKQRAAEAKRQRKARAAEAKREREATLRAIRQADTHLWTTADLNLWTAAGDGARRVGVLRADTKVLVTGREALGRVEVVIGGQSRWVTSGYLANARPRPATCSNGTSVPDGVSPHIVDIHEAVCIAFPEVTTYGTFRGGGGDHSLGLAVDIMTSGARGWQIAEFVRAHYAEFGVKYVIYSQRIWSVQRSAEGWRWMADRGSVTANHYDHVHVSVY